MNNGELQFNRLYEVTKDFGRVQFVKEIQKQINENQELNKALRELKNKLYRIEKNEIHVRDMLYSIENCTLTKERLNQIEEELFKVYEENK